MIETFAIIVIVLAAWLERDHMRKQYAKERSELISMNASLTEALARAGGIRVALRPDEEAPRDIQPAPSWFDGKRKVSTELK